MKNMKKRLKVLVVLMAFLLTLLPAFPASADEAIDFTDTYKYLGTGISGYGNTMKFNMTKDYIAFCVDLNTYINTTSNYAKLPLDHTESILMFENEDARPDKIRAILTYGWDKTNKVEITAIQYALWNEMHGTDLPSRSSLGVLQSTYNQIKAIFDQLTDDVETPPIGAGVALNPNNFALTAPDPAEQWFSPGTSNYSFDFGAVSGANIVFSVFDEDQNPLAASDFEIVPQGGGDYTLNLKNVSSAASYKLEATTLKNQAVNAYVFLSFTSESGEPVIDKTESQTVAGIKLSETTQSEDFTVALKEYTATGSLDLSGMKTLTGRDLDVGEFKFELYEGDELIETVSNLADGSFSFTTLEYDLDDVGDKTYTVKEKAEGLGGVTYDSTVYTVEVNIADNGEGELDITVTSENAASLNFTNTYAAAGELDLSGMKTLTGRDLIDGEFEFELYEEPIMIQLLMEPSLVETVSNDENGIFSFTTLEFGIDDTNRPRAFRVIEKNTGLGGVNYDETVYLIYVFVTDNGDGTLDVEPFIMSEEMSDDEGSVDIVFNNTYGAEGSLDLSGTKTLNGRALAAGEFEFDLYEGETLLETVSNLADGSYSFTSLSFTEADIDTTKTYTVVEKQGTLSNVTYDDTTYTLTVNISDNKDGTLAIDVTGADPVGLDFTNTFTPPTITVTTESIPLADPSTTPSTIVVAREEIPQSGESGPLWPIGLVLLALAGGLGFIVHRSDSRKAQKEKSKKL